MIVFAKYSPNVEFWTCDDDGENQVQIPITLPAGYEIDNIAKLSNDGKKLIFSANSNGNTKAYIYTCNLDGSDLKLVKDNSDAPQFKYFRIIGATN